MDKVFVLMYTDSDNQTYSNKVFLGVGLTVEKMDVLRNEVLADKELLGQFHEFSETNLEIEEVSLGEVYYNF